MTFFVMLVSRFEGVRQQHTIHLNYWINAYYVATLRAVYAIK